MHNTLNEDDDEWFPSMFDLVGSLALAALIALAIWDYCRPEEVTDKHRQDARSPLILKNPNKEDTHGNSQP